MNSLNCLKIRKFFCKFIVIFLYKFFVFWKFIFLDWFLWTIILKNDIVVLAILLQEIIVMLFLILNVSVIKHEIYRRHVGFYSVMLNECRGILSPRTNWDIHRKKKKNLRIRLVVSANNFHPIGDRSSFYDRSHTLKGNLLVDRYSSTKYICPYDHYFLFWSSWKSLKERKLPSMRRWEAKKHQNSQSCYLLLKELSLSFEGLKRKSLK